MRSDLNKLLCERERRNQRAPAYHAVRRSKKHTNGEDLPAHEGMRARYGYDTKEFNENLNPLYAQIRKAVGRPYAKFYSELCQNFDKRSVINQHILGHLEDRLATKVIVRDGELWVPGRYGDGEWLKNGSTEYYVDPRDGIIKRNRHYRSYRVTGKMLAAKRAAEEAKVTRWIDDDNVLRLIDGVWFQFTMVDTPPAKYVYVKPDDKELFHVNYGPTGDRTWDQLPQRYKEKYGLRHMVGKAVRDEFTGNSVSAADRPAVARYHTNKRSASHKMLKQAGLV